MSYAAVLEKARQPQQQATALVWRFDLPFAKGIWQVYASEKGLQAITLLDQASVEVAAPLEQSELPPKVASWRRALVAYLAGEESAIERLPIDWQALSGTGFQKRCWLGLLSIPRGETRSYQWLAEQVGSPKAFRAVGQANGSNPLPMVIPCHRVVGANGRLTGYMRGREGGVEVKAWLLALEKNQ
ncbi:MAG: methylated-DNA--[protein]-cysteine S-methyltransferase [Vampirovibrionales bacterium]|nr:methylated-DNA--[protein]-cysteine S-methyltransferase [Vampirovibrionales bacterium]